MKKEPFITVFTPNYNCAGFISETIESIINQTYENFEYIIIDDLSTDESWKIIQNYADKDKRIRIYRNKKKLGIAKTRNKGFKKRSPKSKYFVIIDSDDVSLKNRIGIQIRFLEDNPSYGLVGSNVIIINENSKIIGFREFPSTNNEIRKHFIPFNPIAQSSVILRDEVINQIGFYDENFNGCEDYEYWLRVAIDWKLYNLKKPLIKYRVSKTQFKYNSLKKTIKDGIVIQNKAIYLYNYPDNFNNELIRKILRLSLLFPKIVIYKIILYFLYKNKFILRFNSSWRKLSAELVSSNQKS